MLALSCKTDISAMPVSVTVPEMEKRISLPYWYLQNLQVQASVCVLFCVPGVFDTLFLFSLLVVLRAVSCSPFDRAKLLLRMPSLSILIGILDNLPQPGRLGMRSKLRRRTRNPRYSVSHGLALRSTNRESVPENYHMFA